MTAHPFVLALSAARRTDLGTIVGTEEIATADEVWLAALAALAAGLVAGEDAETIRHRLLVAWHHDVAAASAGETAFVGTWGRVVVAFDAAQSN